MNHKEVRLSTPQERKNTLQAIRKVKVRTRGKVMSIIYFEVLVTHLDTETDLMGDQAIGIITDTSRDRL